MKLPFRRIVPPAVILFTLLLASGAGAQAIVPVNLPGTGSFRFDQPSAIAFGSIAHVAFIGDAAGDNTFKLYYAAVRSDAPFGNINATQADVLATPAVAIDNGSKYRSVRHPRIAVRSDGRLIVVFQGIPTQATDNNYKLFRALINVSGNAVTSQIVDEIVLPGPVEIAGNLVDPSFQYSPTDQTLRIVYSDASTPLQNVYFLRAGVDNASVAGGPLLLSSLPSTQGVQPLPRLSLDSDGHSHVAWAANDTTGNPTAIFYSMVMRNLTGTQDNVGIGATQVINLNRPWGFPELFADATNSIIIFAADQTDAALFGAGGLAFNRVDPSGVPKDGNPVRDFTGFFPDFPGVLIFSGIGDVYRPEIFKDDDDLFHVAGYGYRSTDNTFHGSPGRYYAMDLDDLINSTGDLLPDLPQAPVFIGNGFQAYGMQLEGDYTRPAFAYFGAISIQFWSGPVPETGVASNLYVTSTADAFTSDESGCSVAGGPGKGDSGFPWGAAVLLPAVFLLLRMKSRKGLGRR
jgi:hypothetical protein